jgi:hypothetical protein
MFPVLQKRVHNIILSSVVKVTGRQGFECKHRCWWHVEKGWRLFKGSQFFNRASRHEPHRKRRLQQFLLARERFYRVVTEQWCGGGGGDRSTNSHLITNGPQINDTANSSSTVARILCYGNVFTKPLPSTLPRKECYTYKQIYRCERFMKYAVEHGSCAMICKPRFLNIGCGIQKLIHRHTDRIEIA